MTNQERITSHNNRLEAMKETVAGLPDAGGGGGGSVVEMITLTLNFYTSSIPTHYLVVPDDVSMDNASTLLQELSINTDNVANIQVPKGRLVYIGSITENFLFNVVAPMNSEKAITLFLEDGRMNIGIGNIIFGARPVLGLIAYDSNELFLE